MMETEVINYFLSNAFINYRIDNLWSNLLFFIAAEQLTFPHFISNRSIDIRMEG